MTGPRHLDSLRPDLRQTSAGGWEIDMLITYYVICVWVTRVMTQGPVRGGVP